MDLLFFTPWPPQKTGIADYTFDLVSELLKKNNISVVTEELYPKKIDSVNFLHPKNLTSKIINNHDQLIYQLGNNKDFHLFMIPFIYRYKGIIHLHDLVIHHLIAYFSYAYGDQRLYRDIVLKWYGPDVACIASDVLKGNLWNSEYVIDIPLFEELVSLAKQVIVHSKFSKNRIYSRLPQIKCNIVNQSYKYSSKNINLSTPIQKNENKVLHVSMLGGVYFNKFLNINLQAIKNISFKYENFVFDIVGEIDKSTYKSAMEYVKTNNLESKVKFHGRVDEKTFNFYLTKSDLIINLRYPSMGEVSAIVVRAIQNSIPVIVIDHAWYSELPDFFIKLKFSNNLVHDLTETIYKYLILSSFQKKQLRKKIMKYHEEHYNFRNVSNQYMKIISS